MAEYRLSFIEDPIQISITRTYQSVGIADLTINLTVQRTSDDKYWSGTEWVDTLTALVMTPNSSIIGEYEYNDVTLETMDELLCHMYIEDGIYKFDAVQRIQVISKPIGLLNTLDTKTVGYALECIMAMFNGKMTVSGDTITIFKRDDNTPFSVITKSDNDRIRVS